MFAAKTLTEELPDRNFTILMYGNDSLVHLTFEVCLRSSHLDLRIFFFFFLGGVGGGGGEVQMFQFGD